MTDVKPELHDFLFVGKIINLMENPAENKMPRFQEWGNSSEYL